jgi:hypothetical protein
MKNVYCVIKIKPGWVDIYKEDMGLRGWEPKTEKKQKGPIANKIGPKKNKTIYFYHLIMTFISLNFSLKQLSQFFVSALVFLVDNKKNQTWNIRSERELLYIQCENVLERKCETNKLKLMHGGHVITMVPPIIKNKLLINFFVVGYSSVPSNKFAPPCYSSYCLTCV